MPADSNPWLLLPVAPVILVVVGIGLLTVGADLLVRGAAALAERLGMSHLVIGLTVVAFGTSMPETAVSVGSALWGKGGVALGNAIGSNLFNVLVVLGGAALIRPLGIVRRLLRLDVPVMIGAAVLVLLVSLDGRLGRIDGFVLLLSGLLYMTVLVRSGRARDDAPADDTEPPPFPLRGTAESVGRLLLGLALLVVGSRLLVDGSVEVARWLGVSELMIGLTVVAAGTSLPELATSFVASWHGHRDIAVGNVVGSNIFNALIVLGLAGTLAPHGILVPLGVRTFDIPVMIVVSAACLPIFFTGWEVSRWEGVVFLAYYSVYILYLALHIVAHDAADLVRVAVDYFVGPLTVIVLGALVLRQIRSGTGIDGPGPPPTRGIPAGGGSPPG